MAYIFGTTCTLNERHIETIYTLMISPQLLIKQDKDSSRSVRRQREPEEGWPWVLVESIECGVGLHPSCRHIQRVKTVC